MIIERQYNEDGVFQPMSIKCEIERKRKELQTIAKVYGISSEDTLRCSEELDKLILVYQQSLNQPK